MPKEYTAIIKKTKNWWIGWIEEFPGVNCQEYSKKELLASLRITLREALEVNRQESFQYKKYFYINIIEGNSLVKNRVY